MQHSADELEVWQFDTNGKVRLFNSVAFSEDEDAITDEAC